MRPPCPSYQTVRDLAVKLLGGLVMEYLDEHGRRWRATSTALELVLPGSGASAPVIEGCAADVALEVVARHLRALTNDD